jgi:hypothetical protein
MVRAYGNYRHTKSAVGGLMVWLVLVILVTSFGPVPVSADVVWSDDFNDGNYDGWTIYGYNFTFFPPTPAVGSFSAADYTLKATGPVYNYAAHPSSVAYGTWSFSVHVAHTPMDYLIIFFLVSDFSQFLSGITGYSMIVYMDGTFELKRHDGMPPVATIASYDAPGELSGLQDIRVTRSDSGQFRVSINGTVQIEEEDSTYTTADDFCFAAESGPAIDNVVVSDTIDVTGVPLELLVIGVGAAAVVVIVALVILKRR